MATGKADTELVVANDGFYKPEKYLADDVKVNRNGREIEAKFGSYNHADQNPGCE
jgi:hypothetical protein